MTKAKKLDPTLPHEITYVESVPGLVCMQGRTQRGTCGRPSRWTIFWKHLHRGVVKSTRRDRCNKHGLQFLKKHGVSVHG